MSLSTPSSRLLRTGTCIPRKAFGRYEFLVCDVSLMKKEPTEKITSQTFVMSDSSEWVLDIYLGGKTERQAGFVTTEVILLKVGEVDDDSVAATINLSLLCQSGTHVNDPLDGSTSYTSLPATTFGTDSETHSTWALDNFIQTSALAQKYIHNDSLLFALDIEITGKPVTLRSAMRAYVGPISTLQLDLASLLNDTETSFSDIVIVVEGQKFYCHKCILAARSTLFNRKFLNPAFKAKQLFNRGEYHMSGINSNIFQCLLRFIYTDECSETDLAQYSCSLLAGAARLQIPRLIQVCEDYIGETLTPEKVAKVLNLAVEVKSERLDICCSDFIASHINNVMATKTLSNLHPQALKNLITRSVIPASALLLPPNSPQESTFNFNSTFGYEKGGDSLFNEDGVVNEELKDPMGSVASPFPTLQEKALASAEKKRELPLEKIKEMALVKIATLEQSSSTSSTRIEL